MSAPTFTRSCIVCGHDMELARRYRDGNELVSCQPCGRQEEISHTGYQVPGPLRTIDPRSAEERMYDDLAAETYATLADARPH